MGTAPGLHTSPQPATVHWAAELVACALPHPSHPVMPFRPPAAPVRTSRRRAVLAAAVTLASFAGAALLPDRLAAQDSSAREPRS